LWRWKNYQPVPSGKANVESANPPPELEPVVPAIPKLHEAQEEAEAEPGDKHEQRGLEENGLGLGELLDGFELEEGNRKAYGVVHAGVSVNDGVGHQ
jgi:hypothetical protein